MQSRWKPFVCAMCGLVILASIAFTLACNSKVKAATEAPSVVQRAAVATVKRETVRNQLSIAGEFFPYQEVELHAKVAGYVRTIHVHIGDHVRAGQVLSVLE